MTKFTRTVSLLSLVSLTLLAGACGGKKKGGKNPNVSPFTVPQQYGMIIGTVKDLNGAAVGNVEVRVGDKVAKTNDQGYYSLAEVPEAADLMVTFSRDGYVPTARFTHVRIGESNTMDVVLGAHLAKQNIAAMQGGTIQAGDLANVTFKPNSLVDANGQPFTGTAQVSVTPFDPTTEAGMAAFPGRFEGIRKDGSVTGLRSLGFMDVTITDGQGGKLQLAPGATADVTFPIAAQSRGDAPNEIPLWYFDVNDGKWKEDGKAYRAGNTYKGTVSHFTIWNCDLAAWRSRVCGRVVYCNDHGRFVQGAKVTVTNMRSGWSSGEDSTGPAGDFCIPVNADETDISLWAEKNGVKSETKIFNAAVADATVFIGDVCIGVPPVRITATWGEHPADLDAHFTMPSKVAGQREHVYYANRTIEGLAKLDTDDTSSFGPEITTLYSLEVPGTYRYSLHHYSGQGYIWNSDAVVHMIIDGVGIFRMTPPTEPTLYRGMYDAWDLWDFTVRDGKIVDVTPQNTLRSVKDSGVVMDFSPTP